MISALVMMALSSCIRVHSLCGCEPSTWAVLGDVVATDAGPVVRGMVFGDAPIDPPATASIGSRVLRTYESELPVDDAGVISCGGITLAAATYAPTFADGGCDAALDTAGLRQGACHDTPGLFGCSSAAGLCLAGLLALALRGARP